MALVVQDRQMRNDLRRADRGARPSVYLVVQLGAKRMVVHGVWTRSVRETGRPEKPT